MTRIALPDGTILEDNAHDPHGALIATTNGAGEGEKSWYDDQGNRVRLVDAEGNVTAWEYDERSLLRRRIGADGLVTEYAYDDKGAVVGVKHPSGLTFALARDTHGRVTATYESSALARGFEYDAAHNVIAEIDGRGARTGYAYDSLGRPVTRKDSLGRSIRVVYDRLGHVLSRHFPDGTTQTHVYDARGKAVRETDRLGRVTQMEYAGMGLLTRLIQPDGTQWSFAYTSQERLQEIKNPRGERYTFTHDDAGRVIEERTFDGRTIVYELSSAGRIARIIAPDGRFRAFSHDRAGRVVDERASDGSVIAYRRDRLGRLLESTLEEGGHRTTTLLERDAMGRVIVERQGDRAVRHAYDVRGRRVERVLPSGATTRYAFDAEDAPTWLEHDGHRMSFERDAFGREICRRDAANGLSIHTSYDAMDRLIEQRATAPAPGGGVPAVLMQRQWTYDRAGRVTRVDDGRWGETTYRYDRVDRLVEIAGGRHREVFAYDAAGSLIQALDGLGGASEEAWEIEPGDRLKRTRDTKYTYDACGRRIVALSLRGKEGSRATEYTWDVRDRLREVKLPDGTRVVMTYDAFGRRLRKEVFTPGAARPRSVDFIWDGDAVAADLDSERGLRCFVHHPGTLMPLLQQERGEIFTYVNDQLGTPRELVDRGGLVAWAVALSAWGTVVETRADPLSVQKHGREIDSPFRLLGQYADTETGLCCARFRHFDPAVGRWCSADPLGPRAGMALFGFDGSPSLCTDPLGLTTRLNLGAGDNPMTGAENVDIKDPPSSGVKVGDASKPSGLPYPDNHFDEVHSVNPYGFNPASAEVARVTKPGGKLYVTGSPTNKFANEKLDAEAMKNGFELVEVKPAVDEHKFGTQKNTAGKPLEKTENAQTRVYQKKHEPAS